MTYHPEPYRPPLQPDAAIILGATLTIGLILLGQWCFTAAVSGPALAQITPIIITPGLTASPTPSVTLSAPTSTPTAPPITPTIPPSYPTSTATLTNTPTNTPTPTVTPTPTLDLSHCNAAGCGLKAKVLPTVEYNYNLLLTHKTPTRRICEECPPNPQLSAAELDRLIAADKATLARLQTIVLSQKSYEIAPGIVYIVFNNVHHIVIDLEQSGYTLRNIIPNAQRGTLITPSYCLSPQSLVVINADYHGLNGSNKTETGRDLFFHLGRAALFQRDGRFDLGVIRERKNYDRATISWGGGPLFIWNGQYNFNPEQEWFTPDNLEYYRTTHWAKISAALSKDRKYLFLTASYGLTLQEHAENIMALGETWGVTIDRAMRFDGGESAYMAIRLGNYLIPLLNLPEPLIVNCLAVER